MVLAIILILSCHKNILLYLLAVVESVVRQHEAKYSALRNRRKDTREIECVSLDCFFFTTSLSLILVFEDSTFIGEHKTLCNFVVYLESNIMG